MTPCEDIGCMHSACYEWRDKMREQCPFCGDSVESSFGHYDADTEDYRGGRWHKVCIDESKQEERDAKVIQPLFPEAA